MGKQEKKDEVVEIPEPIEAAEVVIPTAEELRKEGVGEEEIALAVKNGSAVEKREEKKSGKKAADEEEKEDESDEEEEESEDEEDDEDEEEEEEGDEEKEKGKKSSQKGKEEYNKSKDQLAKDILDGKEFSREEISKYKNFTGEVKALYFKAKDTKKRAQMAERERDDFKGQVEHTGLRAKVAESKLTKIAALLEEDREISFDEIKEILNLKKADEKEDDEEEEEDDDKPLTKADLKKEKEKADKRAADAQALAERLQAQKEIGQEKYGEKLFDAASDLADEVVKADKTNVYAKRLYASAFAKDGDKELHEVVIEIAKQHPDWGKTKKKLAATSDESDEDEDAEEEEEEEASPADKKKVARIVKNAGKRSQGTGGGAGGKRVISHDDLTADDATKLSQEQWNALPAHVRQRILSGQK